MIFSDYVISYNRLKAFVGTPTEISLNNGATTINELSALIFDRLSVLDPLSSALSSVLGSIDTDYQMFPDSDGYITAKRIEISEEEAKTILSTISSISDYDNDEQVYKCTITYQGYPICIATTDHYVYCAARKENGVPGVVGQGEPSALAYVVSNGEKFPLIVVRDRNNPRYYIYSAMPYQFGTWYTKPASSQIQYNDEWVIKGEASLLLVIRELMNQATEFDFAYNVLSIIMNESFNITTIQSFATNSYGVLSSNLKEFSELIIANYATYGIGGVCRVIGQRLFCSDSSELTDQLTYFEFTDNDNLKTESFLTGILAGFFSTVTQIIGSIIALSGHVVGLVMAAAGQCIDQVRKLITVKTDELVYTTYNNDATMEEMPYAHLQFSMQGTQEQYDLMMSNGPCKVDTPFFGFYYGPMRDGKIGFEVHLKARTLLTPMTEFLNLESRWLEGHKSIGFMEYVEPNNSSYRARFLAPTMSALSTAISAYEARASRIDWNELHSTSSPETFDLNVRRSLSISLAIFAIYIFTWLSTESTLPISWKQALCGNMVWTDQQPSAANVYALLNDSTNPINHLISIVMGGMALSWAQFTTTGGSLSTLFSKPSTSNMQYMSRSYLSIDPESEVYVEFPDGSEIIIDDETSHLAVSSMAISDIEHAINEVESSILMQLYTAYPAIPYSTNFQTCRPRSRCTLSLCNGYAFNVPKYDVNTFTSSLIWTAIAGAALAVTSVILFIKIRKSMRRKTARRQAACESAWQAYTEDPTQENLINYEKAVRRNNIFATFTGGTKYAKSGYWDEYGSGSNNGNSDNVFSVLRDQASSLLMDDKMSEVQESSSNDIDGIRRLIVGNP